MVTGSLRLQHHIQTSRRIPEHQGQIRISIFAGSQNYFPPNLFQNPMRNGGRASLWPRTDSSVIHSFIANYHSALANRVIWRVTDVSAYVLSCPVLAISGELIMLRPIQVLPGTPCSSRYNTDGGKARSSFPNAPGAIPPLSPFAGLSISLRRALFLAAASDCVDEHDRVAEFRRPTWYPMGMKRHRTEYTESRTHSPMTPWVHIPSQADPTKLNPLAPAWVPGKGYPVYWIEVNGFTFQ